MRVLPSEAVLVQLQVTTRLESETLSTADRGVEPAGVGRGARARYRDRRGRPGAAALLPGRRRNGVAVELEADVVARANDRRRVRAAVRKVNAALEALEA